MKTLTLNRNLLDFSKEFTSDYGTLGVSVAINVHRSFLASLLYRNTACTPRSRKAGDIMQLVFLVSIFNKDAAFYS